MSDVSKEEIRDWFVGLQERICSALEAADGVGTFAEDKWERPGGGGGRTRIMNGGQVIEKGGVNFSAVWGEAPAAIAKSLQLPDVDGSTFFASGVSIVMHPVSPMVPIIHMNVRYFELAQPDGTLTWWFGGGIDLTPHYVAPADAKYFHEQLKAVCDKHDVGYYPRFKRWADDYFYLKHRNETRGIGGIFFDHLKDEEGFSKRDRFSFVQDIGECFAPVYTTLITKNKNLNYGAAEKEWQLIRRGRYVEFNLVWDRGTKFGLETDGRTESILMSLPAQANWVYNYIPAEGSPEEETLQLLKKEINWLA